MFRRSLPMLMGARPARRKPNLPFLHQSQMPPEEHNIDFNALDLKYKLIGDGSPNFKIPASGWAPPPEKLPDLPFLILRAGIQKSLPVYTDYKGGGTKIVTILRKIVGNIDEVKLEVEKVVGKSVEVRPGKIVIDGNYHKRIKLWLIGLGF